MNQTEPRGGKRLKNLITENILKYYNLYITECTIVYQETGVTTIVSEPYQNKTKKKGGPEVATSKV